MPLRTLENVNVSGLPATTQPSNTAPSISTWPSRPCDVHEVPDSSTKPRSIPASIPRLPRSWRPVYDHVHPNCFTTIRSTLVYQSLGLFRLAGLAEIGVVLPMPLIRDLTPSWCRGSPRKLRIWGIRSWLSRLT